MSERYSVAEMREQFGDASVFFKKIRERLEEHGVSQAELARRSGFSVEYVNRCVRGRRRPSFAARVSLYLALDEIIQERARIKEIREGR